MVAAHEVDQVSVECRIVVADPDGVHLRVCSLVAQQAVQFDAEVYVCKGTQRVNAKSVLDLMLLGAETGTELTLKACGPRAGEALAAIAKFF